MTDYTELVKELRYGAEYGCDAELIERAADAIEELVADLGDADAMTEMWMKKYEALHTGRSEGPGMLAKENAELKAQIPHWVSVEERKPPEYTDVWCAVYTTDIIYMEDGETPEEAIENRQREAARNPRMTLGSYSEDEGWTDGYFGMPMVCRPDYWLEMTIPEPPKEDA